MKTRIFTLGIILFAGVVQTMGQETLRKNQLYMDVQLGTNISLSSYDEPIAKMMFQAKNPLTLAIDFEMQYYPLKHWGILLNCANKAGEEPEHMFLKDEDTEEDNTDYFQTSVSGGIAYRCTMGYWKITSSLAAGIGIYNTYFEDYEKQEGSNDLDHILIHIGKSKSPQCGMIWTPSFSIGRLFPPAGEIFAKVSYTIHSRSFDIYKQRSNAFTGEILGREHLGRTKPGNFLNIMLGFRVRLTKK